MTPSQYKLAKIDSRWALEAQAERQRLIDMAVQSVHSTWWWRWVPPVAFGVILIAAGCFSEERQEMWLSTWAMIGVVFGGIAMHGARHNARRLDALVELLKIDGQVIRDTRSTERHA